MAGYEACFSEPLPSPSPEVPRSGPRRTHPCRCRVDGVRASRLACGSHLSMRRLVMAGDPGFGHDPPRPRQQGLRTDDRGRRRHHGGRRRRGLRSARAVGLRQDDDDEDDQPPDPALLGQDLPRRPRHRRHRRGHAQALDRLRHPADRAVPEHDGRGQHLRRPRPPQMGADEVAPARRRAPGDGQSRSQDLPQALPEGALGRAAAAHRRRARARGRPAGPAHGRAVRGDRPDQPRGDPGRVHEAAGGAHARPSSSSATTSTRR